LKDELYALWTKPNVPLYSAKPHTKKKSFCEINLKLSIEEHLMIKDNDLTTFAFQMQHADSMF